MPPETALYNNRQQMTSLTAIKDAAPRLTLGYGYPAGQNNGNLASQFIADATGSWQQTYTYDSFNRLTHAAEAGSWSETSSYDRWGNRWVSASNFPLNLATPTAATQFDTATNRLQQQSNGQPLPPNAYDAQGNLTNHPWIGQMSYDAEGKIWRHIKGGTTVEFTYDGEGRRVKKRVGTAPPTIYVYDAAGQLAADYGTADGTPGCSTCYITADHLGSTRLTTGATGAPAGRLDYFPFGETIPGGASFGNRPTPTGPRQKFTGKERDQETGLDYFIARYYSAPQGRFTSPDAPFADQHQENPQSWNLYIYVRNNPLNNTDPNGRWCLFGKFGDTCKDKEIPPPPRPPTPKPPAAITPGTPENRLMTAQDAARTNPAFAPQGTPGSPDRRTFCNFATCSIVETVGGPMGALTSNGQPNLANTNAQTLPNSPDWREVTPEEAQVLANQGVVVVAAQGNPGGHGHVATVRPELMPGVAQHLGQAPLINNIGARREVSPAAAAFARTRAVRYYTPANQR